MSMFRRFATCGWRLLGSRLSENALATSFSGSAWAVTSKYSALNSNFRAYATLQSPLVTTFTKLSLSSQVKPLIHRLELRSPWESPLAQQCRTVTKWSLRKGKRKTVKAVISRFYRLNWGIWIRTMAGRNKKKWKKTSKRKIRAQKHVFCNATQSTMLDKMVTKFWRKRKHYVDDIYEPYHERQEFPQTARRPC